jgi:hypothetical protein
MNQRIKGLFLGLVASLLVVGAGTVQDWFGRYEYGGDTIAYLDISKAICRGDWTLALSPYWGIGYPLIFSATRWMFPLGPQGEWLAIHVVNLVLFLATYGCFLYFIKVGLSYAAKVNGAKTGGAGGGFIFTLGTAIFLLRELQRAGASRVNPDLLVSGVFFLMMAAFLHFCMNPRVQTAIFMGLLMGFGYLVKAAFLPISAALFLIAVLHSLTRSPSDRLPAITKLAWALPAMGLIAVPYIAAVSKVLGSFTLGESGGLNYAWNVNGLAHYFHWQGGPEPFGTPIHPTQLLLRHPPVFQFAEPFHVTYPPWFNVPYWYDGYHGYFKIGNQVSAFKSNLVRLMEFFFDTPHAGVKAVVAVSLLAASTFLLKERQLFWKRLVALWPLYLPSIAGLGVYLPVFVDHRYVIGFLIILSIIPFFALFVPRPLVGKNIGCVIAALVVMVSAVNLARDEWYMGRIIHWAIRGEFYTSSDQWLIGSYLARSGVHPGEKVAVVQLGGGANSADNTWAYVSGVHIVAEIGNDGFDPENQEQDFELFTGNPGIQQTVLDLFRQAGAALVVVRNVNGAIQGPGWEQIPGTESWIHRFDESTPLQ